MANQQIFCGLGVLILTQLGFTGSSTAGNFIAVEKTEFPIAAAATIETSEEVFRLLRVRNGTALSLIDEASLEIDYRSVVTATIVSVSLKEFRIGTRFAKPLGEADPEPEDFAFFKRPMISRVMGNLNAVTGMPLTWGILDGGELLSYGAYWDRNAKPEYLSAPPALSAIVCVDVDGKVDMIPSTLFQLLMDQGAPPNCLSVGQVGPQIIHKDEDPDNLCQGVSENAPEQRRCGIPPSNLLTTQARPVNVLIKWRLADTDYVSFVFFDGDVTLWEIQALLIGAARTDADAEALDLSQRFRKSMVGEGRSTTGLEILWAVQTLSTEVAGLFVLDPRHGEDGSLLGSQQAGTSLMSSIIFAVPRPPSPR